MNKPLAYWMGLVSVLWALHQPVQATPRFLDLSKVANMGLTESLDAPVSITAIHDTQEKNGLNYLPVGQQTFRGVPFLILDPAKNNGRSFVVLKGRNKKSFPDAVSIPADHLKAAYLYFLHTCRWGGTDPKSTAAEYDILYDDGKVEVIPLRVGIEFTNFWGADDTSASYLAWWYKYKYAEMGINLFPWKNPRPDEPIQSILFKSPGKMPVPILFAITASDKEIPISETSPKPEKTFQTDTNKWIPFETSTVSPAGTAIDMSFLLDAPAGKHGKLKADGDKLVFEDGTPAKFWGIDLNFNWKSWSKEDMDKVVQRLACYGCNLVIVPRDYSLNQGEASKLSILKDEMKAKGIYILEHFYATTTTSSASRTTVSNAPQIMNNEPSNDPAVIPRNATVLGVCYTGINFVYTNEHWSLVPSRNNLIVTNIEWNPLVKLTSQRFCGKPFLGEWFNDWPNEYAIEQPLLFSTFSMLEGWNGIINGEMKIDQPGFPPLVGETLLGEPSVLAQWPTAALASLRGDLKEGRVYVLGDGEPNKALDLSASLKALAHKSGFNPSDGNWKTDRAGELKAKINEKTQSFVSDTGQISWQGNVGVVKIDSPRFQALIGFLANRKFNNSSWAVETPNLFASISVISLTKTSVPVSDHLLLTGATRMENTGMVYNQTKTKLLDPGKAPILVEPLTAKIVLYRYKKDPKLKVRALDANGQVLKVTVPVKWNKNSLVISWVPSAIYLEVTK